jgi:hypothetical protein
MSGLSILGAPVNPFTHSRPVPSALFVGREAIIREVLSRAASSQSSAIVGESRIGKTSMLDYIEERCSQRIKDGAMDTQCFLVSMDSHLLGHEDGKESFWKYFRKRAADVLPEKLQSGLKKACDDTTNIERERFFRDLGTSKARIVLLLDEFDSLLYHPGLSNGDLFSALRTLSTTTRGLALITTSRLSLAAMNERGEELRKAGSPLFNFLVEAPLPPLNSQDIETLLRNALAGTRIVFSSDEGSYVQRLSGGLPHLVHLVASRIFELHVNGASQSNALLANLIEEGTPYCTELWRHLPLAQQQTLALLLLGQNKGRLGPSHFATPEYHHLTQFEGDLRSLQARGLVVKDHVLGEDRWRISSGLFSGWLASALKGRDQVPEIGEWLDNRKRSFILTKAQRTRWWNVVTRIPFNRIYQTSKETYDRFWGSH